MAVCSAAEPCASQETAEAAADIGEGRALFIPQPPHSGADATGTVDGDGAAGSSTVRMQLREASYPGGVFVLASSDGSGNGYSVEVSGFGGPVAWVRGCVASSSTEARQQSPPSLCSTLSSSSRVCR